MFLVDGNEVFIHGQHFPFYKGRIVSAIENYDHMPLCIQYVNNGFFVINAREEILFPVPIANARLLHIRDDHLYCIGENSTLFDIEKCHAVKQLLPESHSKVVKMRGPNVLITASCDLFEMDNDGTFYFCRGTF
jgi:hypothetical protein